MAEILRLADFGAARDDVWRLGYRGTAVEEFQRRLVEHGFSKLNVTGVVDIETSSAIRALQRALDVEVNGTFDAATRAAFEDDARTGGGATRMAALEWNQHGSPDTVAPGMMSPAAGTLSALSAGEMPQQIQIAQEEPFWKNPMLWVGVGGAALLLYFLTRGEDEVSDIGLEGGPEGAFDVEVMDGGGVEDPADFFGEAPKPRRRKPAKKRAPPKPKAKRKPRKKKEPAEPAAAAPKPKNRKRRKKKDDLAAAPMPTDASPVDAPPAAEVEAA